MPAEGNIIIRRAKVNNLKDITVEIPRNRLVVVTGISGSGKSSLAFDTLFAEGQRRFAESLSSYARQFLGRMSKPDVEMIEGIPPAIAIEQKVNIRNPRSTVATTTEIYDFLRLLFARIGRTYSPVSGEEVKADTVQDVLRTIFDGAAHTVYILSDIRWKDRSDKVELMLALKEEGYGRFFDLNTQEVLRIEDVMQMNGNYPENLYLLVDRAKTRAEADEDLRTRLLSSIQTAFDKGDGDMVLMIDGGPKGTDSSASLRDPIRANAPESVPSGPLNAIHFCSRFERDGMTFRMPDEYLFSFNSPLGACPECGGLGKIIGVSEDLVIPDKTKTIYDGAVACWRGDKMSWFKDLVVKNAQKYDIPVFVPYCKLTEKQKNTLWTARSEGATDESTIVGIDEFFEWVNANRYKIQYKYMLSRYSGRTTCHACGGSRLRKEALYVRVGGKNIHELLSMTIDELLAFFEGVELTEYERGVAGKAIEEIVFRLQCIQDVGLGYLTLSRAMNTLSGGESQRVNLVTALGSSLVGSMYILDEPSIGLHPRDTDRLIAVLKRLRDIGNTVVVVEHDPEIIRAADLLIDLGPKAGVHGGEVVFQGVAEHFTPEELKRSLTLQYLTGERKPYRREKRPWQYSITVNGAMQNNLKDIDVQFPLGALTVVTGVSGSGKSSLVGDILYPALHRRINETGDLPGTFKGLSGNLDRITRVEYVDQNPIGKSSRSNAVTYLKVYDDIRKLLSEQQFAKINGFTPSFFSFNQEGGRCPECQGDGFVKIGMQFMADVTMVCESCGGKRFKPEILEVRYKDKNVDDILNMSVEEAIAFFSAQKEDLAKAIAEELQPLVDVGLGYIKLGQPSSTLSGGESQRIKLAYFLSLSRNDDRPRKDRILFMFDEPTTGLHFYDVEKLLKAFDALLDAGDKGGEVVFAGTPEDLAAKGNTFTAQYLK